MLLLSADEEMEEAEFMAMFICVPCSRCIIKYESHVLFFHVRRKNIIKAACLLAFVGKKKQKSLQSHFRLSVCPG